MKAKLTGFTGSFQRQSAMAQAQKGTQGKYIVMKITKILKNTLS